MALHFPVLITAPKEIPITVEQFDSLSYIGLASFMLHYKVFFAEKEDEIILYCKDWKVNYFHELPRFKEVIPGRINESAELGYFNIPKNTKLYQTINKYFRHLFLKP